MRAHEAAADRAGGWERIGLAALAKMAFQGESLVRLGTELLAWAARREDDADALMDLSVVMQLLGHRSSGLSLQAQALGIRQVYRQGRVEGNPAARLLVIACPGDLAENNAIEFLVEGSDIAVETLYVASELPVPDPVPEHDVAMVAISESERNRPVLEHAARLTEGWTTPVLCPAGRIAALGREAVSRLLAGAPGVAMPLTERVSRWEMAGMGGYPRIVRPVGSHKGQGLAKIESEAELAAYLDGREEREFYTAAYVDYRSADGQFRKYRIVLIDGRPYACHMAVSSGWMVHYISAGMSQSAEKRAEEARFFENFEADFGVRHGEALRAVAERVGLEYFGIDCGETRDGRLLVFEMDSAMTVHAMDPPELYPYKPAQMRKVFLAFRQLVLDRGRTGGRFGRCETGPGG
jgi:glutathione synthase/RimK-type ligase-like ATP-grasp enzyme